MDLHAEIAAYDRMADTLNSEHRGKWVLIRESKLVGAFDTFSAAANHAIKAFGRGPYLIRQVGAPQTAMRASVVYRPAHADQ